MIYHSDLKFFTPQECEELVQEFFTLRHFDENQSPEFYKNSYGFQNQPGSLKYIDRAQSLLTRYDDLIFANTYTRCYQRHSVLKIHTDRKGLDVSLSVCLEDKNNLEWPLKVSTQEFTGETWDFNERNFKDIHVQAHIGVGYGAVVEGRRFPHWRDELLCGEKQRAIYLFFHWTFSKKKIFEYKNQIEIEVYKDFITPEECQELINMAAPQLVPSTVIDYDTGASKDHKGRTSQQTFLKRQSTLLIKKLENKIAQFTNTPVQNGEDLQILKYEPGQEYEPHHDFFFDKDTQVVKATQNGGQRVATMLLYLNTPVEGATEFPELKIRVPAIRGHALLFRYPAQERESLHAGTPPKSVKWVATKWIREGEFK